MASLNVHMPVDLRDFVNQRTKKGGFSTPTEYVRHLIREDQQREAERRIEELFADGIRSGRAKGSVEDLFKQLHKFVAERTEKKHLKRGNGKAPRSNTGG
jgi:antitoxin ParD1/3/4